MSSKVRGYSGFYKENYLRSSYEYVYCKILEKKQLKYKVEEIKYDLQNTSYIPDFHIYDNENKLVEIVEIKSNNQIEINKTIKKIDELKKIVNVPVKIYLLKDLKKECEKLNLQINDLISYWINNSVGNPMDNIKNPMFGKHHREESKKLISKLALKRCESKEYRDKISKGLIQFKKNGNVSYRPQKTIERIISNCIKCNDEFEKMITSFQIYCSNKCKLIDCTELANNSVREKNKILHDKIKIDILDYTSKHQDLFFANTRNKLYSQYKIILNKYDLKDIRNIKFIFTQSYTCSFETLHSCIKQELLNYLKCMPNLHDDKV
jgi:endogenous inhibitor of DNA gyrase (YacG/DUF329 family)